MEADGGTKRCVMCGVTGTREGRQESVPCQEQCETETGLVRRDWWLVLCAWLSL